MCNILLLTSAGMCSTLRTHSGSQNRTLRNSLGKIVFATRAQQVITRSRLFCRLNTARARNSTRENDIFWALVAKCTIIKKLFNNFIDLDVLFVLYNATPTTIILK